ncbi:hypothetical protein V8F06_011971 [Rhypophila decipiens]
MSSDNNSNDHDSDHNSDDYYRHRDRSPSIEIDWPPIPTGCGLCPFRKFKSPESVQEHKERKQHRPCDQCKAPLTLEEAYYCASPEDWMLGERYYRGVPNRHVRCKPVHPDWGKKHGDATESLILDGIDELVVMDSGWVSGGVNDREGEDVGFTVFAAQGDMIRSDRFLCWVCQQVCVSQLALHGHFERTGHGLCLHYLAKRRREEEDDDEGDTVMLGSYERKRKRSPRSPPPLRQRPPRGQDENRQAAHNDCPNEIRYFNNWFHLQAHLRIEHKSRQSNLRFPMIGNNRNSHLSTGHRKSQPTSLSSPSGAGEIPIPPRYRHNISTNFGSFAIGVERQEAS